MADTIIEPVKSFKHGESGYNNHGCRCEICYNARRTKQTIRARNRRQRNPEKARVERHAEYLRHKDRYAEWGRQYYLKNKDRVLARHQRRRATKEGKGKNAKAAAKRRKREASAAGLSTPEQIAARAAFYGNRCYLCGAPAIGMDHVIAIGVGGTNWPANMRPACWPCNNRKGKKRLHELPSDMEINLYIPKPLHALPS